MYYISVKLGTHQIQIAKEEMDTVLVVLKWSLNFDNDPRAHQLVLGEN